jgi:hypothetical protein
MEKRQPPKKPRELFAGIPARSILVVLIRDVRGTAAEKLALLDRLKVAGRLTDQDPAELAACEALLKSLASQAADRTL